MKYTLTVPNQDIKVCVIHLCSIDNKGDFQIIPDKNIELDMAEIARKLCQHGMCCDNALPEVCLMRWNDIDVTVYPGGHLLLQHVNPDSVDNALQLGTQLFTLMLN